MVLDVIYLSQTCETSGRTMKKYDHSVGLAIFIASLLWAGRANGSISLEAETVR